MFFVVFFFFKQKTAYEMRISDWSSDVCSSDLTSGVSEWGAYWAGFIRREAGSKPVNITEMWDNWNVTSDTHKQTIDHPELYDFVDISQNSQTNGQDNWDKAQYVLKR